MERPKRLPQSPVKSYDLGFKNGALHGFDELGQASLTFLQEKYITADDRPDRGSPRGEALLQLARELSLFITDLKMKKIS